MLKLLKRLNRGVLVAVLAATAIGCELAGPSTNLDLQFAPVDGGIQSTTLVFKETTTPPLEMDLYFPDGWTAKDKRPAIVFFFGGGWRQGTRTQFTSQCQYFASRGIVAATADYRVKDTEPLEPDKCIEDGKSAIRWLRANARGLGIDPNRVIAGGGSAGAHVAACTAFVPGFESADNAGRSSTPNALVLFNPVLDIAGEARIHERLGNNLELARAVTPNLYMHAKAPPAILFYGSDDRLLPHGERFVELMNAAGNRAEIHITPGVGHGFFNRPPHRETTLALADEFLVSLGYLEDQQN